METLKIIQNDPWLSPYKEAIEGRHQRALDVKYDLTDGNKMRFTDFADGEKPLAELQAALDPEGFTIKDKNL